VTGEDRTVAVAFGTFDNKLSNVSVPSEAASAASALAAQGAHCQQVFEALADSTTVSQYEQTIQTDGPILTIFSADYQRLIKKLE
jgi:hypothetical protein